MFTRDGPLTFKRLISDLPTGTAAKVAVAAWSEVSVTRQVLELAREAPEAPARGPGRTAQLKGLPDYMTFMRERAVEEHHRATAP